MIIVHLSGGLGNQMFQYATAKAMALRRGVELRLDISSFKNYSLHNGFELKRVFRCPESVVSNEEMKKILGWRASPRIRRLLYLRTLRRLRGKYFVVEPEFSYWPGHNSVPSDGYLVGYWQSERYFEDVAPLVRQEFKFKSNLSSKNSQIAELIANTDSVSLHVRRGDYIKNKKTFTKHGTCSADYYQVAMEKIATSVKSPFVIIFSDDIQWVKKNLEINYPCRFIDHNAGTNNFEDMRLMSLCKHHVIANSSFSWWGAWLGSSSDQIVIAPEPWFDDAAINTEDLLPCRWTTIPKNARIRVSDSAKDEQY